MSKLKRAQKKERRRLETIKQLLEEHETEELKKLTSNSAKYEAVDKLEELKGQIFHMICKYRPERIDRTKLTRDCPKCKKKDPNYDIFNPTNYHQCHSCKLTWWYCSYHDKIVVKDTSGILMVNRNDLVFNRCMCNIKL